MVVSWNQPENRIFCHVCPNVPKKREDLNGRHNFFCICRLARLKIYVRGLLLYFHKNKKFLKLVNFSRTCTPLKIENHENKYIFFMVFDFQECTGPAEVGQLQKKFFFWKYNSNPLTYIFNLARRQIQKKLCRPFKSSLFLGTFGQKWQKMRFSGIKMIKNIIFRLVSWYDHYARCKAYTLVNSQKKKFLKLGNFTTHYSPLKRIYKIYIYCVFFEVAKTSKWSCPTSIFFHFLTLSRLLSNIYFEAREGIKTRWDTPIWIWVSRIADFCTRKRPQLLHLRDIYSLTHLSWKKIPSFDSKVVK